MNSHDGQISRSRTPGLVPWMRASSKPLDRWTATGTQPFDSTRTRSHFEQRTSFIAPPSTPIISWAISRVVTVRHNDRGEASC
jgi:hypothetical protein